MSSSIHSNSIHFSPSSVRLWTSVGRTEDQVAESATSTAPTSRRSRATSPRRAAERSSCPVSCWRSCRSKSSRTSRESSGAPRPRLTDRSRKSEMNVLPGPPSRLMTPPRTPTAAPVPTRGATIGQRAAPARTPSRTFGRAVAVSAATSRTRSSIERRISIGPRLGFRPGHPVGRAAFRAPRGLRVTRDPTLGRPPDEIPLAAEGVPASEGHSGDSAESIRVVEPVGAVDSNDHGRPERKPS